MAKKKITLGIDARLFGVKHRGLGRYTESLLEILANLKEFIQVVAFVQPGEATRQKLEKEEFRVIDAPYPVYTFKEQTLFFRKLKSQKLDLVHFPHFNMPYVFRAPYVLTIHDLILHHFPSRLASTRGAPIFWLKYMAYRLSFRRAILGARMVIAVSDYTAEDILTYYPSVESRVQVIGESVNFQDNIKSSATDKGVNLSYNVKEPYVLIVGAFYPHKNLDILLSVWPAIYRKTSVRLVLVGKIDIFAKRLIAKIGNESLSSSTKSPIQFTGEVDDIVLDGLYKKAKFVLFPSLSEGFGLPGVEALVRKVPLVSSSATALPETYGSRAIYLSPKKEHIYRDICRLLENEKYFKFESFSPKNNEGTIAEKLLSLYQRSI